MPEKTAMFADQVREAAAWMHRHANSTFVVSLVAGDMSEAQLAAACDDLAMLCRLGTRVILIYSQHQSHPQIASREEFTAYCDSLQSLENTLLRNLQRLPRGGWRSDALVRPTVLQAVRARGVGVVGGKECPYYGALRSLDTHVVEAVLKIQGIAVLPVIANSLVGVSLALDPLEMACEVASLQRADKWILLTASNAEKRWQSLAKQAVAVGVDRVHHVQVESPDNLITELFSNSGAATMVVSSTARDITQAKLDDLGKLEAVLEEAEREGSLVKRSRNDLECNIDRFLLLSVDDVVAGCGALLAHEEIGEIAALSVLSEYRSQGIASRILVELELRALQEGMQRLVVLTTHAIEWFEVRGYKRTTLESLPKSKRDFYNYSRNSVVVEKYVGKTS